MKLVEIKVHSVWAHWEWTIVCDNGLERRSFQEFRTYTTAAAARRGARRAWERIKRGGR